MAEIPKFDIFQQIDIEPFMKAMADAVRPIKLSAVALEAIDEVAKAHAKHGSNADLADGTGPQESILLDAQVEDRGDLYNVEVERALQRLNDKGCARGRTHTRLGILLEEAFEAAAAADLAEVRKELIQVIAMGLDWVVDIDDRGTLDDIDQED